MLGRSLLNQLQKYNTLLPYVSKFRSSTVADIGIVNGTILNGDRKFLGDVYIKNGKIISVDDKSHDVPSSHTSQIKAKRTIDAKSRFVMPGGIDPHTHLQLPFMGEVSVDDFNHGHRAALSGGTTCHIDFIIPNKDGGLIEAYDQWREWADSKVNMDFALHCAITNWNERISEEMGELVKRGVTSFKIFLAYKGMFMVTDEAVIAIMKRAKQLGALVMVHAENGDLIADAQSYIVDELGITGPEGHYLSRPPPFEAEATHRAITIANYVNTPLYVVHVQSNDAGEMVRRARLKGYSVYAECLAAGLGADGNKLWDEDFDVAAAHVMSPPINCNYPQNKEQLIGLIQSGDLSTVATDNCTFSMAQKRECGHEDFRKIPNGVNGIEDRLSIVWDECVVNGSISEMKFVDIVSSNAAKIFNLYPQKGRIAVGSDADIVIWNGNKKRTISAKTHHHHGDFNIFEGREVYGNADITISNGNIVYEDNELISRKGDGKYIARKAYGYPFDDFSIAKRDTDRKPKAVDRSGNKNKNKNESNTNATIPLFNSADGESFGIENIIQKYVRENDEKSYEEIMRIVYGNKKETSQVNQRIETFDEILTPKAIQISSDNKFDIKSYRINGKYAEEIRSPRTIRIAAIQNKYQSSDFQNESVLFQKNAMNIFAGNLIESAAECGVNVLCFQECWNMPFAFCTREKHWPLEFAEYIDLNSSDSISLKFISEMANKYNMCIISPQLERDTVRDTIHNTAIVIGNDGEIIGKHRKNHIPRVGDFNESTYYMEGDTGHPVFSLSDYHDAKIAINICYGRHHPLNWQMFGLNGAEIVFNPSATTGGLSEHLWHIEARNAAIANNYYTVAINRIGTEHFSKSEFTSGDGKPSKNDFGYFYGSSYISAPDGSRTSSMSRINNGLLIADCDLNLCRQVKDEWGFQMTARYELYAKKFNEFVDHNGYTPQIVYDKPKKTNIK